MPLSPPRRHQVRRLAMYNNKAKRDKKGRIISQDFQSKELPSTRIQPDRRWFGNTRVIGQKQLEAFREEMGAKVGAAADPWRGCRRGCMGDGRCRRWCPGSTFPAWSALAAGPWCAACQPLTIMPRPVPLLRRWPIPTPCSSARRSCR